jgi:hypothetical protein
VHGVCLSILRKRTQTIKNDKKIISGIMNIEYTSTPASADIDFLTKKINQETPEFGEAHPFAFFI